MAIGMNFGRALALVFAAGAGGTGAAAQSSAEFTQAFSGEWYIFESSLAADGGTCRLQLALEDGDAEPFLPASVSDCADPLSRVRSWSIEDGVLTLYDGAGTGMVRLGGNQRRITGDLLESERGVIVERAEGDGYARGISLAIQRHRCIFRGTTSDCVDPDEMNRPVFAGGESLASVETLANLAVRGQPRRDSESIGTVPSGSCIRVNQCVGASDGIWCRARFGDTNGWLAKTALRQGEWPVVTYLPGCGANETGEAD